jgi:hypothetical protein
MLGRYSRATVVLLCWIPIAVAKGQNSTSDSR